MGGTQSQQGLYGLSGNYLCGYGQSVFIKSVHMDGAEFYWAAPSDLTNNGELISTALKNPPPAPLCAAEQIKIWKHQRGKK